MAETENKNPSTRTRRRRGRTRSRGRGSSERLSLHQRSTSHFKAPDRSRGERYFDQGRVTIEVNGSRARAQVRGQERKSYGVGVDWSRVESERRLHVFCDCERFAGGAPCKHVWATLLELDSSHPGVQPTGKDRLGVRKDRASQWADLGVSADHGDGRKGGRPRRSRRTGGQSNSPWRSQLDSLQQQVKRRSRVTAAPEEEERDLQLLVNAAVSGAAGGLVLDVFERRPAAGGKSPKLRPIGADLVALTRLFDGEDAAPDSVSTELAVVAALPGEPPRSQARGRGRSRGKQRPQARPASAASADLHRFRRLRIPAFLYDSLLPRLCEQGRIGLWDGHRLGDPRPLRWDDGEPWRFALRLEFAAGGRMRVRGVLERGDDSVALSKVQLVVPEGGTNGEGDGDGEPADALVFFADTIAGLRIEHGGDLPWIELLSEQDEVVFPEEEVEDAVTSLLEMPELPRLETPEGFELTPEVSPPQPRLVLEPEDTPEWMNPQLLADVSFRYGEVEISAGDESPALVDFEEGCFVRRDMEVERQALVRLLEVGLKPTAGGRGDGLELDPLQLPPVAETLLSEGWEVVAKGVSMRSASPPALRVKSGVDWFELSGQVDFEGDPVEFSRILEAISRGERTVELEDGSRGVLPSDWIDTYDSLAQLAQSSSDEGLRFLPSQALLVDALLVAMPPANVDKTFAELRDKLRTFDRIEAKKEPRGFKGTLRGYQRMGLGWLCFLREFGLGGILADDMGLGKTVQALALMRTYRTASKSSGKPYLVVAPRSLVYNWIDEASRFTPDFKVVEYGGPDREELQGKLGGQDLVVTTYGTLRRDIGFLATVEFDTVILDEAQAIKNPESQTAKASRLLNAQNRLALTGTPIENHLGELGSIFEFLNPGLLGRLPALDVLAAGREASQRELALVAKGIRPFILRRTKAEVLADLPEKTEQILYCRLRPQQRELYDQLRAGYRETLLEQVEAKGVGGSTMQVLEALLRLRQVACHPGLVDDSWNEAGSAKLEALFEQVSEVLEEGHKVVVFSQFTSLLAYVREELDQRGVEYAYLDGQTRNRGEVVERFQTDPACNLFLISLKAGGVGLNLTAASYVFLLDPWWNPAVEAQAIDRAHRIGQKQPVFAYRLIARDTVEERMVELQASKRKLADAILEGEGTAVRDLSADDLRMLLS